MAEEKRDLNVRGVFWSGLGLIFLLLCIGAVLVVIQKISLPKRWKTTNVTFPDSGADFESGIPLQELRDKQLRILKSGPLPIDQAMKWISEKRTLDPVILGIEGQK